METRLKKLYDEVIAPNLIKECGYKNKMEVPKLTKIVLNMGVGESTEDKKAIEFAVKDMEAISGQKPIVTHARKSISTFKLRDGMPIGCKVTISNNTEKQYLCTPPPRARLYCR